LASAIPLKFEFDNTTPSSLAEFTAANTVSVINGGTGVSSLELLGASLSSIDLSSTWVSATNITATNVSATSVSSTYIYAESGVSSTTVSGSYLIAANEVSATTASATHILAEGGVSSTTASSTYVIAAIAASALLVSATDILSEGGVSANALSATTITGADSMPLPAPFGYVQTDTDGTDSTNEQNFGLGATTTNIVSNSDDISWDDSAKNFIVGVAGTYEVFANNVLDTGTQSDLIDITILKNGSDVMSISPRCFGNHGPFTRTILGVTTAAAADTLTVSIDPQTGPKTVTLKTGSSMTVKRLK